MKNNIHKHARIVAENVADCVNHPLMYSEMLQHYRVRLPENAYVEIHAHEAEGEFYSKNVCAVLFQNDRYVKNVDITRMTVLEAVDAILF